MCLSLLLLLLPLADALPASTVKSEETTQIWTVTRLDYHYMTEWPGFGPPHTEWPEDKKFKSEISFDVQIPDPKAPNGSWKSTCGAKWQHSLLPKFGFRCDGEQDMGQDTVFSVAPWKIPGKTVPPGTPDEMPFMLSIDRTHKMHKTGEDFSNWTGNVTISCDDPSSATGYLTCLTGPPYDGMRCRLHNIDHIDLSNKKELQIVARRT